MLPVNEEKYFQALVRGRGRCSYGRVMFLGAAAVGKTSLRHGLMNQRLPQKANSTILAETHSVKNSWAMTSNHKWDEMADDDEIAEEIRMVEDENITMMPLSFSQQLVMNRKTELTELAEHKEKVLQQAKVKQSSSKVDHEVLLHLWDCGGQPVFLDVLPAFLSSRTMFLLVFNASKGLEAPYKVFTYDNGVRKYQGLSITTLSLFHKWMAVIHARFGGTQQQERIPLFPRILLVGTHADQIQVASDIDHEKRILKKQLASRMCEMFYESIKGKEYADLVIGAVVLDNTTAGTSEADPGFQEIQKKVYHFVRENLTRETPISWIHFRKVLQLHTRKKKKVISLDEVHKIAAECRVAHNKVTSALLFYHDLGVFLFYPEVKDLKSVVILEPQWLVDQFGKLFANWKGKAEYSDMWNTLTQYGVLVEPLYEAVLGGVSEHDLTPVALIKMLEHFRLAAPIVTTDLHTRSSEVKEYFIPHMLQHHLMSKSSFTQAKSFSLKNAAPFHLIFRSGYVPPGFYVRLATSLASKKGVIVFFRPGIYRDQITMGINVVDRLTITEHTETIELQYSRRAIISEPFKESCRRLLELLNECFSEVYQWLPGAKPQLAFPCLDCAHEARPDIPSRAKFCPFTLELSVSQHLLCQMDHISLPTHDQQYWLHYEMNATEHDQAQFEKKLQLTTSISADAAFDLADRLEVNPLSAIIHQYRRIGGDDTVLVQALSEMKLTTLLDAAGMPVLDVDISSSAAPQASSSQIPNVQNTTVPSTSKVSSAPKVLSTPTHTSTTTTDTGHISSDMHSKLIMPPDLLDLLNKVAAETTDKWDEVAVQLGIKPSRIRSIQAEKQNRPIKCYTEIFDLWESKGTPPYTWATIINALRSPAVEEERLANELEKWLLS